MKNQRPQKKTSERLGNAQFPSASAFASAPPPPQEKQTAQVPTTTTPFCCRSFCFLLLLLRIQEFFLDKKKPQKKSVDPTRKSNTFVYPTAWTNKIFLSPSPSLSLSVSCSAAMAEERPRHALHAGDRPTNCARVALAGMLEYSVSTRKP